ncbi:hypothetical protein EUX98_g8790 [Antrodiella citrinella]|uniref:Peptidase M24 domain-containing protein n=1 Tax=Antrodiella citrinella TaxID=2447956 RepID=A0A4S4M361_9APHY|nr:hypothetical protein EUX98_g8790 [Antrodiella citrinella]
MTADSTSGTITDATKKDPEDVPSNHVESEDENDEGEEDAVVDVQGNGEIKKKKKKKKPKKKKAAAQGQSEPPRVGLSKLFPDGNFPEGELQEYKNDNAWRTTSEEMRYNEKMAMEDPEVTYSSIRRAAEVHRQVRKYAQKFIHPGMTMTEIAESIEDGTRALVEENGLESGVGFPTGVSLNHCAAHYTPNAGDTVGTKPDGAVTKPDGAVTGSDSASTPPVGTVITADVQ